MLSLNCIQVVGLCLAKIGAESLERSTQVTAPNPLRSFVLSLVQAQHAVSQIGPGLFFADRIHRTMLSSCCRDALRSREVVRSSNNPTGDYAEYLFCRAFRWKQAANSERSFDAVSSDRKTRYQIKGSRVHDHNKSRQLSAIRDLEAGPFDVLAGVIFNADFQVSRAALIPRSVIVASSTFMKRTNSYRFLLKDNIWQDLGVQDVTADLVEATP